MNKVWLTGNLTRDPEMRSTSTGVPVCNFSIAVNRRFKNAQTGEQETDFFNIVAWRQLAELCSRYLAKGRKVAVFGSIQTRTYEDKNGGGKRTAFDIVADEVEFLSAAHGNDQEAAYVRQDRAAIQNEPAGSGYQTAVSKQAYNPPVPPAYSPADAGFTQVDDDELPF